MSTAMVESRSSWEQAAEAIDRAQRLLADVPSGYGYELAPETHLELRGAAVLMQRAAQYLRTAVEREAPRLRQLEAGFEARGEPAPWDRDRGRVTEDGD